MQIEDMQQVTDFILTTEKHSHISIEHGSIETSVPVRRNNRRNRSGAWIYGPDKKIEISYFIFDMPEEVQLAEIIHETCHFLCPTNIHHGPLFREKEIYWLSQFGLKPRFYKRAYYRCIETLNGNIIPTRNKEDYNIVAIQAKLRIDAKTIKKRKHIERVEL